MYLGTTTRRPLSVTAGTVFYTRPPVNEQYPEGTDAYLSCNSGYSSSGVDTTSCFETGNWKDQAMLLTCTGMELADCIKLN